jgi:hypothetical protein
MSNRQRRRQPNQSTPGPRSLDCQIPVNLVLKPLRVLGHVHKAAQDGKVVLVRMTAQQHEFILE